MACGQLAFSETKPTPENLPDRRFDPSAGLQPGTRMIKRERYLLAANCHTDIASMRFAKPSLLAGIGQGKEQAVCVARIIGIENVETCSNLNRGPRS
jgi:hypothetical protein